VRIFRVGVTNRLANKAIITELEREKSNTSFDEEINLNYNLNELDLSPLIACFNKFNKTVDNEKLKNLKLIKSYQNQIYPTNALLILLEKFDNCKVKCSKFKGTTMDEFIDRKEYDKDIFSIFENLLNFVLNHINLSSKIENIVREDKYEIPLVALRKALINALIHRDYTNLGRDIKVGIYDDMVNIVSPGGYPSFITQDDVDNGRSEARNRVVANIFKELGLIEQWGSGIKRIKHSCKKAGLKEPVITKKNDFVDVEIYRLETKNIIKIDDLRTITNDYNLLEDEKNIIKFVINNGKITRKEVSKILTIKETKAYELLYSLTQKGYLERKGKGRGTYYTYLKISF
jgi:ATP-dependent DNA helicase